MNQDDKVRAALKAFRAACQALDVAKDAVPRAQKAAEAAEHEVARTLHAAGKTLAIFDGLIYKVEFDENSNPKIAVETFEGIIL